jgi:hypothetical protein
MCKAVIERGRGGRYAGWLVMGSVPPAALPQCPLSRHQATGQWQRPTPCSIPMSCPAIASVFPGVRPSPPTPTPSPGTSLSDAARNHKRLPLPTLLSTPLSLPSPIAPPPSPAKPHHPHPPTNPTPPHLNLPKPTQTPDQTPKPVTQPTPQKTKKQNKKNNPPYTEQPHTPPRAAYPAACWATCILRSASCVCLSPTIPSSISRSSSAGSQFGSATGAINRARCVSLGRGS